jgi:hypothetical protein
VLDDVTVAFPAGIGSRVFRGRIDEEHCVNVHCPEARSSVRNAAREIRYELEALLADGITWRELDVREELERVTRLVTLTAEEVGKPDLDAETESPRETVERLERALEAHERDVRPHLVRLEELVVAVVERAIEDEGLSVDAEAVWRDEFVRNRVIHRRGDLRSAVRSLPRIADGDAAVTDAIEERIDEARRRAGQ